MDSKALSLVMAKRLKELRVGKGQEGKPELSHSKLGEELSKKYGDGETSIISKDSLQNYEVADPIHSKAYTNNGMKVEYLRFFADFYGVSADYLLGLSEVSTRNETIQRINAETGLSEDAISRLREENSRVDDGIRDFISYLVVNPRISELIAAVKGKNMFAEVSQVARIDIGGVQHETDMQALFKMIVSDLFFEIIGGYTAKPGEIMLGYKDGGSNG